MQYGVQVIESAIEPMSSLHIPAFVQKMGITFPVGYDEQTYASKFLGRAEDEPMLMPQVVFIDRKGNRFRRSFRATIRGSRILSRKPLCAPRLTGY